MLECGVVNPRMLPKVDPVAPMSLAGSEDRFGSKASARLAPCLDRCTANCRHACRSACRDSEVATAPMIVIDRDGIPARPVDLASWRPRRQCF
jgi:hypothetical protein